MCTLGHRIQLNREKRGMKQEELAEKAELSTITSVRLREMRRL